MKVYHGNLYVLEKPDLKLLKSKTNFGKGFYTTTSYDQAVKWTEIKKSRIKDNKNIKRYINVYEYNENIDLEILNFNNTTEEWLDFVFKNRNEEVLTHSFDIVKGPVANDNLYQVLVGYDTGLYDKSETIKRLKTYLLSNQISFHKMLIYF